MMIVRLTYAFCPQRLRQFLPKKLRKKVRVFEKGQAGFNELADLEFMLSKSRAVREGYRNEFDRVKEKVIQAQTRIKMEESKKQPDLQVLGSLQQLVEQHTPELKYFVEQMDKIDKESKEYERAIEGYRSILDLVKDFIKKV